MDEISNKTLATLLVVAIVISLAGTFFAMRGVSQYTKITGYAGVDSGETGVYINQTISITLNQAYANFGSGNRNETYLVTPATECNLSTDDAPDTPNPCWTITDGTTYAPQDLTVENDGNVFVSVDINGSVAGNAFFDNCDAGTPSAGDPNWYWIGEYGYSGNSVADTSPGCQELGTDLNDTANFSFTTAMEPICLNLSPSDVKDEFNISIGLNVPPGVSGWCNRTVTLEAALS